MQKTFQGDLIAGVFRAGSGALLRSVAPARGGAVVLEGAQGDDHVALACAAAAHAQRAWAALDFDQRWAALWRFRGALLARKTELSDAICWETGKLRSEAAGEVGALIARFDLVRGQAQQLLADAARGAQPDAWLRYKPLGVVAVIGPFNYPLHLCHAHTIPALLLGNTVVIKPAETTLLCGQLYAQCAADAGLPPGVVNAVQGGGDVGAALVKNPDVRGVCFTGSWATGRRISAAALDRPELLVALEMGGKNPAIVLEDADLRQAAHEIAVGAWLTTGQRCTCTERALVDVAVVDELTAHLAAIVSGLRYGDPEDPANFAGPMATLAGAERTTSLLNAARTNGVEEVARGQSADGAFYRPPTLHLTAAEVGGYTDTELFGPDLAITPIDGPDHAAAILSRSTYGLAASVFTASSVAYEQLAATTHAGLLHHNRTTNQASGALPFGGVGASGNYRPAGSFAVRNVVYPVASMTNPTGGFVPHPHLAPLLPGPDLDALIARHAEEEAAELAAGDRAVRPRLDHVSLPKRGHLPQSDGWLARLYAGDRMAREKKPGVVDLGRSFGAWMCSVDDEPLCVMDAMSQTATIAAGFAPDEVAEALWTGEFDGTLQEAPVAHDHPAAIAYTDTLRHNVPGFSAVAFANSGAEANEKAIALAALHRPDDARAVLAFEGSFHGRTLLALHATWNPTKREPFTVDGFGATFAPFPRAPGPVDDSDAPTPDGYLTAIARADLATVRARFVGVQPLLDAEIAALETVHIALAATAHVAVLVEPMQSEGGDRYASARFFRALRLLTRAHDVPLIFDEVQCGFGLSGPFAWHSAFDLVAADGSPDFPDAVTFAKRAQVGVVMSNWSDPEPTQSHAASLVRGRLHADISAATAAADRVSAWVKPRLADLATRFPELVGQPRSAGFALAFDLPTPADLSRWLGQRFWRGAVVFGAGDRTVRYRLSRAFGEAEIDALFLSMRRTAAWIVANPGAAPPTWQDFKAAEPAKTAESRALSGQKSGAIIQFRQADPNERASLLPAILALEAKVYEPARRDSEAYLARAFAVGGVAIVAEDEAGQLVGSCLAAPLELFADVPGCAADPELGKRSVLYAIATTVDPDFHGLGVGTRLKTAQIEAARARYQFVTGRNRVGSADPMTRLVRRLGGHVAQTLHHQYGDEDASAIYYRIPLRPLTAAEHAAITKVTICNYVTPPIVRAIEHCCALVPQLPHLYLTSCRDELVDKGLRIFRWRRKKAQVAITFSGMYFGHTTAAARTLSDPSLHKMGQPWLSWPVVPHPADIGSVECAAVLARTIAALGAETVLCVAFEAIGDRSGRVIPDDFWPLLDAIREDTGVPLFAVDTAGARYATNRGAFAMTADRLVPDLLGWWTGGQTGLLHVAPKWFERKPLTFVSTWDGDELSLIRVHRELVEKHRQRS